MYVFVLKDYIMNKYIFLSALLLGDTFADVTTNVLDKSVSDNKDNHISDVSFNNGNNFYFGIGAEYVREKFYANSLALDVNDQKYKFNSFALNLLLGFQSLFPNNCILGLEMDNSFSFGKRKKHSDHSFFQGSVRYNVVYIVTKPVYTPSLAVKFAYNTARYIPFLKFGVSYMKQDFGDLTEGSDTTIPLVNKYRITPFMSAGVDFKAAQNGNVRLEMVYNFKAKSMREYIPGDIYSRDKIDHLRMALRLMFINNLK